MDKIELGDRVQDKVSGLKGICVAYTKWLNGCVRLVLQPEIVGKDGKVPDTYCVDEPQCLLLKKGVIVIQKSPEPEKIPVEKGPRHGNRDDSTAVKRT